jgi:hypothetical protein
MCGAASDAVAHSLATGELLQEDALGMTARMTDGSSESPELAALGAGVADDAGGGWVTFNVAAARVVGSVGVLFAVAGLDLAVVGEGRGP